MRQLIGEETLGNDMRERITDEVRRLGSGENPEEQSRTWLQDETSLQGS